VIIFVGGGLLDDPLGYRFARISVSDKAFLSKNRIYRRAARCFLLRAQGVTPDATALVGGLAIGERELLSPEMAQNMKTLSLTHLVAVSGANLAIIMGVVYLLTAALGLARNTRFVTAFFGDVCLCSSRRARVKRA